MASKRRPNLFIIGAMKCGTTSLHEYLGSHPQIFMCEPKEPWYFVKERNWSKGEKWYLSLFAHAGDAKVIGESSADYTKAPMYKGVPERIARFNPEARFIYIMRDPIERTLSHYWHHVRWHAERRDILTAIRDDPQFRAVSHYAMQLTAYFDVFGANLVYTLTLEQLLANPKKALWDLFSWLGVDSNFRPANLEKAYNPTPEILERVKGLGLMHKFRYSMVWDIAAPVFPNSFRKFGRRLAAEPVDRRRKSIGPVMDFLRPIQVEQTQSLSKMLGRQFPEWKTLYR